MSKSKAKAQRQESTEEAPDRMMRIRVGGPDDIYELDLDDLTFGEAEEMERIMNRPMGEIFATAWVTSAAFSVAVAYIAKRRVEPLTTLESIRAMTGDELDVQDEAEARPTETPETNGRPSGGKSGGSDRGKSKTSDPTS